MMFSDRISPRSAKEMYEHFALTRKVKDARVETFFGTEGFDVYNPSIPFEWEGKTYLAGRMERRESERSEVRFFERCEGGWRLAEGTERLPLQDPFVTFVDGKLMLGGVSVIFPEEGGARWHTEFYLGSPFRLEKIARGPDQMKDIRLVQLKSGKIAVTTRPQGACMEPFGCIAKVGFLLLDSLGELTPGRLENAPYLEKLFCDDEWGGTNQLIELANGKLGVIGHKSCRTYEGQKAYLHYYGIAFAVDPATGKLTQDKMIVSSDCFPPVDCKREDLADVTFTSGIVRLGDGTARVYTGLADANVASALIPDPFEEYEI